MPSGNLFHTNGMSGESKMKSDEVHSAQYWLIRKIIVKLAAILDFPISLFCATCAFAFGNPIGYVYLLVFIVIFWYGIKHADNQGRYPDVCILWYYINSFVYLACEWNNAKKFFYIMLENL